MLDLSLSALTKAWVITVIASGLLLIAVGVLQVRNGAIYLPDLPQALQLIGDESPPFIDRWN